MSPQTEGFPETAKSAKFAKICQNLPKSAKICKICQNLQKSAKFAKICQNLQNTRKKGDAEVRKPPINALTASYFLIECN